MNIRNKILAINTYIRPACTLFFLGRKLKARYIHMCLTDRQAPVYYVKQNMYISEKYTFFKQHLTQKLKDDINEEDVDWYSYEFSDSDPEEIERMRWLLRDSRLKDKAEVLEQNRTIYRLIFDLRIPEEEGIPNDAYSFDKNGVVSDFRVVENFLLKSQLSLLVFFDILQNNNDSKLRNHTMLYILDLIWTFKDFFYKWPFDQATMDIVKSSLFQSSLTHKDHETRLNICKVIESLYFSLGENKWPELISDFIEKAMSDNVECREIASYFFSLVSHQVKSEEMFNVLLKLLTDTGNIRSNAAKALAGSWSSNYDVSQLFKIIENLKDEVLLKPLESWPSSEHLLSKLMSMASNIDIDSKFRNECLKLAKKKWSKNYNYNSELIQIAKEEDLRENAVKILEMSASEDVLGALPKLMQSSEPTGLLIIGSLAKASPELVVKNLFMLIPWVASLKYENESLRALLAICEIDDDLCKRFSALIPKLCKIENGEPLIKVLNRMERVLDTEKLVQYAEFIVSCYLKHLPHIADDDTVVYALKALNDIASKIEKHYLPYVQQTLDVIKLVPTKYTRWCILMSYMCRIGGSSVFDSYLDDWMAHINYLCKRDKLKGVENVLSIYGADGAEKVVPLLLDRSDNAVVLGSIWAKYDYMNPYESQIIQYFEKYVGKDGYRVDDVLPVWTMYKNKPNKRIQEAAWRTTFRLQKTQMNRRDCIILFDLIDFRMRELYETIGCLIKSENMDLFPDESHILELLENSYILFNEHVKTNSVIEMVFKMVNNIATFYHNGNYTNWIQLYANDEDEIKRFLNISFVNDFVAKVYEVKPYSNLLFEHLLKALKDKSDRIRSVAACGLSNLLYLDQDLQIKDEIRTEILGLLKEAMSSEDKRTIANGAGALTSLLVHL